MLLPFTYNKPMREGFYLCKRGFPLAQYQVVEILRQEGELCYYSPGCKVELRHLSDRALFSRKLEKEELMDVKLPKIAKGER